MQVLVSHTGISGARLRFSLLAVAVGNVPSQEKALTGRSSPWPARLLQKGEPVSPQPRTGSSAPPPRLSSRRCHEWIDVWLRSLHREAELSRWQRNILHDGVHARSHTGLASAADNGTFHHDAVLADGDRCTFRHDTCTEHNAGSTSDRDVSTDRCVRRYVC